MSNDNSKRDIELKLKNGLEHHLDLLRKYNISKLTSLQNSSEYHSDHENIDNNLITNDNIIGNNLIDHDNITNNIDRIINHHNVATDNITNNSDQIINNSNNIMTNNLINYNDIANNNDKSNMVKSNDNNNMANKNDKSNIVNNDIANNNYITKNNDKSNMASNNDDSNIVNTDIANNNEESNIVNNYIANNNDNSNMANNNDESNIANNDIANNNDESNIANNDMANNNDESNMIIENDESNTIINNDESNIIIDNNDNNIIIIQVQVTYNDDSNTINNDDSENDESNTIDNDESNIIINNNKNNIIIDNDESNIITNNDESNIIIENDESNIIINNDESNMIIDNDDSNIIIDNDESNMIIDNDENNMIINNDDVKKRDLDDLNLSIDVKSNNIEEDEINTKLYQRILPCLFFGLKWFLQCNWLTLFNCCINMNRLETIKYYFQIAFTWIYMIMTIYTLPFIIYWYKFRLEYIPIPYWISVGSILLTNTCILTEMVISFYKKMFQPTYWERPIPNNAKYPSRVICMFAAYLPNEVNTLEGPIRAMINMEVPPNVEYSVMVVHNGGNQNHLNKLIRLIRLIRKELPKGVNLNHLEVTNSKSKAENINAAVDYFKTLDDTPYVIGIFDADHYPHQTNLKIALKTMVTTGADIVQGRNCIGRGSCFLAIEFDIMYCVYHPGGSMFRGFGLFGGSNGYWKFDVLDHIRMDHTMLTEDIDSAMRALRNQYKVVYNRNIISTEEAPPTFDDLVKQRLRWNQGWTEVSVKHSFPLMFGTGFGCFCCRSPERYKYKRLIDGKSYWFKNIQRRTGIFFLLVWREFYCYLAAQALPAGVVALIKCEGDKCVDTGLVALTIVLFIFPVINSIVAFFITGKYRHPKLTPKDYIIYAIFSMFYELLKFHLSVLGHARNLVGLTKWRVTKRSGGEDKPVQDEITETRNNEVTKDLEIDLNTAWHGNINDNDKKEISDNIINIGDVN